MTLADYLALHKLSHRAFCERIGVAQSTLAGWLARHRFPTPEGLAAIERATGGAVTASDMVAAYRAGPAPKRRRGRPPRAAGTAPPATP